MRKIIIISMTTLDGVIQGPGAPEEDRSGDFAYGGWSAPYSDETSDQLMQKLMVPSDLLLGRKTFDIWEEYWPLHAANWPGINEVTKYVYSTTRKSSGWENSVFLSSLQELEGLKSSEGGDLKVWGSSQLIQLLLEHDLADELWLIFHPITLGRGKKLFTGGAIPAAFTLLECTATPSGLIFAHYQRAGEVRTGIAGA